LVEANLEAGRQTFERLAREWFENIKTRWALIHAQDVIRSLERDVFPMIGALPIGELNAPLVLAVLREIESRGAIETAKRVRQRISSVFVFAIAKGITQSDPAEEDCARPITRLGLRFLALTAVRPSELRGAL